METCIVSCPLLPHTWSPGFLGCPRVRTVCPDQRGLTCQSLRLVVSPETELVNQKPAPLRPVSSLLGSPRPHVPLQMALSLPSCLRVHGDPIPWEKSTCPGVSGGSTCTCPHTLGRTFQQSLLLTTRSGAPAPRMPSPLLRSNNKKFVPSMGLEWAPGTPTFPFCHRNNTHGQGRVGSSAVWSGDRSTPQSFLALIIFLNLVSQFKN